MRRTDRRLTAVMFTDVVGYSALVNADEAAARKLLDLHSAMLRRHLAQRGGRHIDTTGDGNLAIFDSALAATECAVALQHELFQRNASVAPGQQLRLRIGLHQGDLERGNGQVFGDGVNVCARIEPLSPRGGIAASAMVVGQVHGPLRAHFRSAGPQALKNIPEPVEIFLLDEAGLPAAAAHLAAPSRPPARRWPWVLAAAATVLFASAAALLPRWLARPAGDASLAILPLENLSTEPGSAEFVGGLHDSLLTEVSKLPQLRVISRSSVMRYAHERPGSPEIGRLLHVANLLEGSVQRVGQRIRVNVQLIRAETDEHLWAEVYDRDIEDLFQLQNDISREIARKIRGNLVLAALPAAQRPTTSVEAYDLYLRAIDREDRDPTLGYAPPDEPLRLLEQAVQLDPNFTLAHAALARFAMWGAQWAAFVEPARLPEYVARASRAASRAMSLEPELPESLLAMGQARYWSTRDPAAAQPYFERALAIRPGFPLALYLLSGIYAELGQVDRGIEATNALLDVDPNNGKAHEQLVLELTRLRRYAEADEAASRWLQATEAPALVHPWRGRLHFYRTGELAAWKESLAPGPGPYGAEAQDALNTDRWSVAMYEGRYSEAAAINRAQADEFVAGRSREYRWAFAAAQALAAGGELPQAQPYLQAVAAHYKELLASEPDRAFLLAALAQMQVWLGEREAALVNARRAVEISKPGAKVGGLGGYYENLLAYAQVSAHFGLRRQALDQLATLLDAPSDVHAHVVLRDPFWAPLDRDAEFQALVRRHLPAS
ncbi:MAG TPA: adenylate/guanylate cyclase domain-containing protein [Solimonas sp.]|nr:adenylate/guanylate cyclase domain-containing protein [Solimonas sp.]